MPAGLSQAELHTLHCSSELNRLTKTFLYAESWGEFQQILGGKEVSWDSVFLGLQPVQISLLVKFFDYQYLYFSV